MAVCAMTLGSLQAQDKLMITGVMDGTLTGGVPKVVEVFAREAIPDLSEYALRRSSGNSGTWEGPTPLTNNYILPAISLNAGDFYYAVGNSFDDGTTSFDLVWPAYSGIRVRNFGVNSNGDDTTGLWHDATGAFSGSETLVDVMGELGVDGSGQTWEHLDGWAYSNNGRAPSPAFNTNLWTFSGANAMDGFTASQIADSFPDQTYITNAPAMTPPTITAPVDQSLPANTNTGPLDFLVDDIQTPVASLTVTATSDNTLLVPNNVANLILGGSDAARTIDVVPAAGQEGLANIELVVTDGDAQTGTNSFTVIVGAPTISSLKNQITPTNMAAGPLAFTVGDVETPAGSLVVTGSSSRPDLIPHGNITISNLGGSNRTVTVTPLSNTNGYATITLTVSDGLSIPVTTSFLVTVYPQVGVLLSDDFSLYADGSLITNSGFIWDNHGGTDGQTQVSNSMVLLSGSLSEDVNALLVDNPSFFPPFGGPDETNMGFVLYAGFKVNFSGLPGGGNYFAHFRGFSGGFVSRIYAGTTEATSGYYRMGIRDGFLSPTAYFPRDLALDATYVVVIRLNTVTTETALWVNPVSEQDAFTENNTPINPVSVYNFALRQSGGIGDLAMDDLVVGTSFDDVAVAVAPEALLFEQIGSDLVLSWSNPLLILQSASDVGGPYIDVIDGGSPYTNALAADQMYFRLKY